MDLSLAIVVGVPAGLSDGAESAGARLRQSLDDDTLHRRRASPSRRCCCSGSASAQDRKSPSFFSGCVFPELDQFIITACASSTASMSSLARSFRLRSLGVVFKNPPARLRAVHSRRRSVRHRPRPTGVAIAEWFGATEGLGYLIFFAGQTFNIPVLFVGVAVFAALGILGFEIVRRVEIYATPWRKRAASRGLTMAGPVLGADAT